MITDTNADLNVYLETEVDGVEKVEPGQGSGGAQCCGVITQDETATSCQTGQCCSGGSVEGGGCGCGVGRKLRSDLKGQNLNDWAGKYIQVSLSCHKQKLILSGSYKIFAVKL